MTKVNAKSLKTTMITGAYDLAVDHFTQNADALPGDTSPQDHVRIMLGEVLTTLNYQRAGSLPQILQSHDAKVKRGAGSRANPAEVCDTTALLFKEVTGVDLDRPKAAAPAAPAAAPATSSVAAEADTAKTASQEAAEATPVAARAAAQSYDLAPGSAAMLNPMTKSVTGGRVEDITKLFDAIESAKSAAAEASLVTSAYKAAIAAYEAGDTDVDTDALVELTKFKPSGLADLPVEHDLMAALDTFIAQQVTPTTSFGELVGLLAELEGEVAAAQVEMRGLKRDLRRAQPKTAVKVGGAVSVAQAQADTLSEIDEINADCAVVMELAADLFPRCYGTNPKILQFDVPKLDFGQSHPDVPVVDDTFRFHTRPLVEALHAISENEIIWLHGESGCGKSDFWAQVAANLNMPFTRLNLDSHLARSDVVGGMAVVSDGQGGTITQFVEGALPRAMARPGILLLDEFDCGDPEIMPIFQPVLEGKPIVLLEDGGRIVRPHPQFRIAITGNSKGLGSSNQMYLNVHEQSAATRDRISAFVEMQYMPPEIEKEVVLARFPAADDEFVEKLIQLANKVREGYRNGDIHSLFSTRAVLACARRFVRFAGLYPTPEDAVNDILETVIMNRLDDGSHNTVRGLIDNIFPT